MLQSILNFLLGSQHERNLKELLPILHKINEKETWAMLLRPEEFREQTERFRERYQRGESLDSMLPEAFALVREAARRKLGERHYDVQLLGGIVLHQGKIMEMKTGEGKTLSSVTAAFLNSLSGKGVHVVTVNDYLAERDAAWMGPVYSYLGVTVGSILTNMAPSSPERKAAYAKDITYGTNNEFGFDYLRDNMAWSAADKVQRGHNYCVVDEIDSILIDEARTPLIISGAAEDDTARYFEVDRLVEDLKESEKDPATGEYPETDLVGDYKLEEKNKRITFTDDGMNHIEQLLMRQGLIKDSLFQEENFEYIHYFTQAMKAHKLFHKEVDYVVQEGQVQIVDEFTGRILYGRRYSDGLHQAIEAKEKIKIAQRNRTLATITFQNFFRMYDKIAGMTGTADTEAREFSRIYNLDVVVIPTNRAAIRLDDDDVIYLDESFKYEAICDEIELVHKIGQPTLVGTVSIEKSERLAKLLQRRGIRHEVLNAKNHAREALIIAEAGAKGAVTIATNMAGRGTDIKLGGNPEYRARRRAGTDATEEDYRKAYELEYENWKKDYEGVKEVGGLYILGTERHEARRIDNQLRGRSGRQGDPGKSKFFISLDDDLMRLFNNESLKPLMARIGMKDGEPIYHPWINRAIERAQSRVEERNFEIRKHLLEYDDVLNEQRTFIYAQRDAILLDDNLIARIVNTAEELVGEAVDEFLASRDEPDVAIANLLARLKEDFFFVPRQDASQLKTVEGDNLKALVMADLRAEIETKAGQVGRDNLNLFIRFEYLRNIDVKWQDHLDNLEALREAVMLRTYGQKNPLLEYKLEGFQIFDKLIYDIKTAIAKKIFKVQIQSFENRMVFVERTAPLQASHQVMGQFAAAAAGDGHPSGGNGGGQAATATQERVTVTRSYPKVGRNDPCPCGSGKKYKYCHGR